MVGSTSAAAPALAPAPAAWHNNQHAHSGTRTHSCSLPFPPCPPSPPPPLPSPLQPSYCIRSSQSSARKAGRWPYPPSSTPPSARRHARRAQLRDRPRPATDQDQCALRNPLQKQTPHAPSGSTGAAASREGGGRGGGPQFLRSGVAAGDRATQPPSTGCALSGCSVLSAVAVSSRNTRMCRTRANLESGWVGGWVGARGRKGAVRCGVLPPPPERH